MTRKEAFDILGISESASHAMVLGAYKMKLGDAKTETEKHVYNRAYLVITGTYTAEQESAPTPKPKTSNVSRNIDGKSNDIVSKGKGFTKASIFSAVKQNTGSTHKNPTIYCEDSDFEGLTKTEPSRVFRSKHTALKVITRQQGPELRNWSINVLPGEREFLSVGESGCYKWSLHSAEILGRIGPYITYDMFSVQTSINGKLALVTGISNGIDMFDVTSGKKLKSFSNGHEYWTRDAIFLPDERYFVSVGWDGKINKWDVDSGIHQSIGYVPDGREPRPLHMVEALDNNRIITLANGGIIQSWDTRDNKIKSAAKTYLSKSASFSTFSSFPDRKLAISVGLQDGGREKQIMFWNIENEPIITRRILLPLLKSMKIVKLSPSGDSFVTSDGYRAFLWDTETLKPTKELVSSDYNQPLSATNFTFAPSGDFLMCSSGLPQINLWRL